MDKKTKKVKDLEPWQTEDAARLRRIFESPANELSQLKFGANYDIGSAGMVWQYLSGHRPLNIKAAVAFARGLNCKVEDFSQTIADEITEAFRFARGPLPSVSDATELHRLSKDEVHLLTRFRLTDDEGRAGMLDDADILPTASENGRQERRAPIYQVRRKDGA